MPSANGGGRFRKKQREAGGGNKSYVTKVRYQQEDGEIYGCVEKAAGNGRVVVMCIDGVSRECIIRKKFKGRNKRDNLMSPGVWCLVGIREWEHRSDGSHTCDLLHVYRDSDMRTLRDRANVDFTALIVAEEKTRTNGTTNDPTGGDDIVFIDDYTGIENDEFKPRAIIAAEDMPPIAGCGGEDDGGNYTIDFDDI